LKIETRYQHFELNEDMTSQIINRVRFALNRFGGETGHLQVHFPDTNGPEGGLEKHCSLLSMGFFGKNHGKWSGC